MHIIALTGGIGCGKSTAANTLRELGAGIVDADAISRSLTAPGGAALPAIVEAFGNDVIFADGTLNRKALAAKVFPNRTETLNAIMHPLIRGEMENQTEAFRREGKTVVVLDVPLLFEAGMQDMAQVVLCVCAPRKVQIERLRMRDGMTALEAEARIASQMPVEEKAALSDYVISTDRPQQETAAEVVELYHKITGGGVI